MCVVFSLFSACIVLRGPTGCAGRSFVVYNIIYLAGSVFPRKKRKEISRNIRRLYLYKHMYTPSVKIKTIEESKQIYTRRSAMKGYLNEDGYMGFVNGRYILFASEAEYEEYMMED